MIRSSNNYRITKEIFRKQKGLNYIYFKSNNNCLISNKLKSTEYFLNKACVQNVDYTNINSETTGSQPFCIC